MRYSKLFIGMFVVCVLALSIVSAVVPYGVESFVSETHDRATVDVATSTEALAGNVTELIITGYSTTQTWQGYFGNVSGTIQLADSADNVMYNWSLTDPEGEVYATETNISSGLDWSTIDCFEWVADDGVALETTFAITQDDVDGINETFDSADHTDFYTNNRLMSGCMTAYIFDDSGASVDQSFEQVILADDAGNTVWTAILENTNVLGFDGKDHDFEMLVPEDGHGIDTDTTTYYFYIELE